MKPVRARELESRTSIRNIVVLFSPFVNLDNSRERTRDLWMKGGIFKTEIIKNKIIHYIECCKCLNWFDVD